MHETFRTDRPTHRWAVGVIWKLHLIELPNVLLNFSYTGARDQDGDNANDRKTVILASLEHNFVSQKFNVYIYINRID